MNWKQKGSLGLMGKDISERSPPVVKPKDSIACHWQSQGGDMDLGPAGPWPENPLFHP